MKQETTAVKSSDHIPGPQKGVPCSGGHLPETQRKIAGEQCSQSNHVDNMEIHGIEIMLSRSLGILVHTKDDR